MTAFEELGVIPELGAAVSDLGWQLPTAIQCEAIPAILGGGDVLIAAETGSGKTGAFSLPVAQIVWEKRREALDPNVKKKAPSTETQAVKLSVFDKDPGLAVNSAGLLCESNHPKAWNGARATQGVHSRGKYYYEATIKRDGLCRVGWSTLSSTLNLGTDDLSFGFGGTGKKSHAGNFDDYGDVLGCCLDLDAATIHWAKNGEHFPMAYRLAARFRDPELALFPAVLVKNSCLELNFGDNPFRFAPPSGYMAVSKANPSNVMKGSDSSAATSSSQHDSSALSTPFCLIMEPTRELAQQTHKNIQLFCAQLSNPPIRSMLVVGGVPIGEMLAELQEGVEIITGTVGRIGDLFESGQISLKNLRFFVVDEADQMLSNKQGGAARTIERMLGAAPRVGPDGQRLQLIVCSATLHNQDISKFAAAFMHFPQWIDLKGMDAASENVHHVVCYVDPKADKQWIRLMHAPDHLEDDHVHANDNIRLGSDDKDTLSLGTKILKGAYVLKAIDTLKMEQCIVFCRTKQQCDQMETFLRDHGHAAVTLHGDRDARERSASLQAFKEGRAAFLVCTDVAARGLDITGIPYVINVTLPDEKQLYVHRIGRVGRADRMGLAISLVSTEPEKVWYHQCKSRGIGCNNTRDVSQRGCTLWYDEKRYLGDIEEHLGVTVPIVDSDFVVPTSDFDGKVVYGSKRAQGDTFEGHATEMAESVRQLAALEDSIQLAYLYVLHKPASTRV